MISLGQIIACLSIVLKTREAYHSIELIKTGVLYYFIAIENRLEDFFAGWVIHCSLPPSTHHHKKRAHHYTDFSAGDASGSSL